MLSSWVSRRNGGVFEAVVAQADMLRALGAVPLVLGIRDEDSEADAWRLEGIESRLVDRSGPAALAFAPDLNEALGGAELDLLHLHGIWQYPSHVAGDWADGTGKPLVISPHGMLDPWITGRNAWKKHLARWVWERQAWRSATAFHALTEAEAQDIGEETGGARVAVIPNPAPPFGSPDDLPRMASVLYIGRIHEKKNIAALVEGWVAAKPQLPEDATLTIAGWGDDTGVAALEQAMRKHREAGIEFVGTAFGSQKAALLDLARFVVLPSLSEGLPMAILEAWSAGVPSIMTRHCHLPEGFEAGAAIECGTDAGSIRDALVNALSVSEGDWQRRSAAARQLAAGPFSPGEVAGKWERLYSALLEG
ncbi:glycosyltransferase [Qipengyuania vesicularis]|uniref:glycosyltransferase n=1 Tax=Qipengyuania vesicularis TaxID=2867232 RepID=UPI001C88977B|nr:glycosyltransferase [Qipengyuania vesicularis]MBX7527411.1 glycosyltransferase [Qipengyuania vesicularis]